MAIDAGTFPRPRTQRAGPTPTSLAAEPGVIPAPPISHVIPFALGPNAANSRTVRSAGPFKGPAIVTGIHFSKGGAAAGIQGVLLGKSASSVSETGVANTTARPWTALYEPTLVGGAGAADTFGADVSPDMQPNLLTNDSNLAIVILDARFFVVVCALTTGAATFVCEGHLTLLEQVNPEALANFL